MSLYPLNRRGPSARPPYWMRSAGRPRWAGSVLAQATYAGTDDLELEPAQPVAIPPTTLVTKVTGAMDNTGTWLDRNAKNITSILDSVGRLRQSAKAAEVRVADSYDYNIRQPVAVDWFGRETILPGLSNGMVIGGAVGLGLVALLLVSRSNA